MRPQPAHLEGTPKIIQGNVKIATFEVYQGSSMRYMDEIEPHDQPYQKNNMNAWLDAIQKYDHNREFIKALRIHWNDICYEVNDHPVGSRMGRPQNRIGTNVFTYHCGPDWRVRIVITTEHYNKKYHEKIRIGGHVPGPKRYVKEPPTISMLGSGKVRGPILVDGRWEYRMFESGPEYFANRPKGYPEPTNIKYIDDSTPESRDAEQAKLEAQWAKEDAEEAARLAAREAGGGDTDATSSDV